MKIIVSALQLVSLAIGSKAFDTPVPESHEVKEDFLNAKGEANYFFHTNNVDKYTIDDKNWSTDTFTLGDLNFEDTYGYSQTTIMAPAKIDLRDQLTRTVTFPTPTHAEHMLWYTGRVWADGELYRNKLHAHNMVFESSEFFLAEPRDLGLDQKRMQPAKSYEPLQTNELGFSSNAKFRQWLMDNLEEAQRKYDQNCVEREDQSHEACGRPRPRLVCIAKYDSEGFHWGKPKYHVDRRPKTHCKPWKFREGDAFTVTGFSRHLTEPTKPDQPGYVPAFIPGHISWHMWWYHDTWTHSYFNRIVCNQKGIWFDSSRFYGVTFPFKQVASLLTEGGIPKGFTQSYVVDGIAVSGACLIAFLLCRAILRKSNEFRYKKLS